MVLSEASQILRRYVAAAFAWPPAELTTAEFSAALAGDEKIGPELARTLSNFLRECDERKFAPAGVVGVQASACSDSAPATPGTLKRELQPAAVRALELVSAAEARRVRSAPVPGAATRKGTPPSGGSGVETTPSCRVNAAFPAPDLESRQSSLELLLSSSTDFF